MQWIRWIQWIRWRWNHRGLDPDSDLVSGPAWPPSHYRHSLRHDLRVTANLQVITADLRVVTADQTRSPSHCRSQSHCRSSSSLPVPESILTRSKKGCLFSEYTVGILTTKQDVWVQISVPKVRHPNVRPEPWLRIGCPSQSIWIWDICRDQMFVGTSTANSDVRIYELKYMDQNICSPSVRRPDVRPLNGSIGFSKAELFLSFRAIWTRTIQSPISGALQSQFRSPSRSYLLAQVIQSRAHSDFKLWTPWVVQIFQFPFRNHHHQRKCHQILPTSTRYRLGSRGRRRQCPWIHSGRLESRSNCSLFFISIARIGLPIFSPFHTYSRTSDARSTHTLKGGVWRRRRHMKNMNRHFMKTKMTFAMN